MRLVYQTAAGKFGLRDQRTGDTCDKTWSSAEEAEAARVELDAKSEALAASRKAKAATRAKFTPQVHFLSNGEDR